jgi:hypothetical protein
MAIKPLSTSRTRDLAGPAEPVASAHAVSSTKGVESPGQHQGPAQRQPGDGQAPRRPREQRELEEQRHALARMILGVFEPAGALEDAPAAATAGPAAGEPGAEMSAAARDAASAAQAARDLRLELAIVEFMYALFHALDQIDDAEPTLAHGVLVPGGVAAGGRSAFGERLDLLAARMLAVPAVASSAAGAAHHNGVPPRLMRAYEGVLHAIHGVPTAAPGGADPRQALAALLRRLANAMHVAPTLGYSAASTAGGLLRVSA